MGSYVQPKLICMTDIESLDVGPRSIVSQVAMVFAPVDDPETVIDEVLVYLPIQPQIALKRTLSAKTLVFWMSQSDAARKEFEQNTGDDFEELPSLIRHLIRKFGSIVGDEPVELWARGPQFDVTNIESLALDCGLEMPWRYDSVRDLRTLMALAGLKTADIPRDNEKYPPHMAVADCHYQIQQYAEAMRQLRARN